MPETAEKYRETGGTKDIANDSYTASKIEKINTFQWEEHGNAQGATDVICRLVSFGDYVYAPANPTRVYNVVVRNTGSSPITINPGNTRTMPTDSIVYDCSMWGYYYTAPSYDYVGYYPSSHRNTEETKTFLVKK